MLLRTLPLVNDFENIVVCLGDEGELAPSFRRAGIQVIALHWKGFTDFGGYRRIARKVRELKPFLVVTYLFHADAIGRLFLALSGLKVVPFLRTTYNGNRYRLARWFEFLTSPMVRRYLANSESISNYYSKKLHVSKNKFIIIPNGIDLKVYQEKTDHDQLRKDLGIVGKLVVICVANLHPNKGQKLLVEAFAEIAHARDDLRLLLVGDGFERDNLTYQVKQLSMTDKIKLLGRQSDVAALLQCSDIFSLPTHFEGMSNSIMEAMAASLPCVVTAIPENRVLITDDKNGLLFKVDDGKKLRELLSKLIADPSLRARLGEDANKTIEREYSLKTVADKLSNVLASLGGN